MLSNSFNPDLKYKAVVYARMSTDLQNERSPEQQLAEIKRRLKATGRKWQIVKIYQDEGISGRYLHKRTGYQQMMREIKMGSVTADVILVDTIERFGRVEELQAIRKTLHEKYGVLVLTADSNFADPNTPQGKALGMFEAMRATEDGRIKAHNVLRGKRDSVLLKHWPGGSPPFGYMLKSVMKIEKGREEVDYCVLVPDPTTAWIIQLLFETAENTSWGTTRLAKFLNLRSDIPEEHKPFQPETIGYWLDQEIYYGEMLWNKNATGIHDDTHVVVANPIDEVIRVPEYCEPLVSHERWQNVQGMRNVRRARSASARRLKEQNDGKLIQPVAPGLALNYLLSGLLFCECGLRMTASSTGKYTTKGGEDRRYVAYVCPGYLGGHCDNNVRVPEEWIRTCVVNILRDLLFRKGE